MSDPANLIFFASPADWREWLLENHANAGELWVGFHKKKTGRPSLTWQEAVEQALCFGWIDGIRKPVDQERYTIRFTPRRPGSVWSKINAQTAERLLAENRMHESGLRGVERAKADGRWQAAYDSPATASMPPDLQEALETNSAAREFYGTLSKRNSYAILYRVQSAKKPETRARRIQEFVEMLARGEKIYP
jgi:uncharacterized protein YdeI (YjbR/CyaY-like superfamily)